MISVRTRIKSRNHIPDAVYQCVCWLFDRLWQPVHRHRRYSLQHAHYLQYAVNTEGFCAIAKFQR